MADLSRLRNFKFFAENFFKIRTKSGAIIPFELNRAQEYIHERLEAQLKETGKVRAYILKGRQQGCSTYVQARYFHKTITNRGYKTFILTHESAATKNLFEMTKRYYEYLPDGLCPKAGRDSVKELRFDTIDSGYAIGTAGAKGTGRSQTVQLLHGSEVAFWPNADEHAQGLMQAVSDQSDTEIILESTANGIGNFYHSGWVSAEQGKSNFQAIFVPWYWQPEYRAFYQQDDDSIELTDEEHGLLDVYEANGLTRNHLYWRRYKIGQFSNDHEVGVKLFNQEYPFCANDAFLNPVDDTFIVSSFVAKARKTELGIGVGPLMIGVDPAIGENDRCAIIKRKGRVAYEAEVLRNYNTMELAGKLKTMIDKLRPHRVFIDCIGIGAGVVDRLHEMGYSDCVVGVNVARTANDKERFGNLRAELWAEMRDWLMGEIPVQIPDSDEIHRDLCGLGYKHRSNGQLLIESKDELKKRGFPSPDIADALALTFTQGHHANSSNYEPNIIPQAHQGMFI